MKKLVSVFGLFLISCSANTHNRIPASEEPADVFNNPAFSNITSHVRETAQEIFAYRQKTERGYRKLDPDASKNNETPPVRRDTHAKTHACTMAEFRVNPNIQSSYRVGLFAQPGAKYKAWIRFANGLGQIRHDFFGDARAMSVKVMGVRGKKILENFSDEELFTQDFIMNNAPTFFVDGADDSKEFFQAEVEGRIQDYFKEAIISGLKPFGSLDKLKTIFNAVNLSTKVQDNLLTATYWSGTPFKFGEDKIVKFIARPCQNKDYSAYRGLPPVNSEVT